MLRTLQQALITNGHHLPDETIQTLAHYLELLRAWNKVFNLTAITDPTQSIYLHIIDSLTLLPYLNGNRFLDVGSGAGLPGIPLAILNPKQQWVLLDKNSKKTRFLTQVIAELKLTQVEVVQKRAEDFHPSQCFDSILSRAYATLRVFVETTAHLLCKQGTLIAMKGKYPQEELNELNEHVIVQDVCRLDIKGIDIERHVVRIKMKN